MSVICTAYFEKVTEIWVLVEYPIQLRMNNSDWVCHDPAVRFSITKICFQLFTQAFSQSAWLYTPSYHE